MLNTLTDSMCPHSTHQIWDPKVVFIVVREVSIENDMIDLHWVASPYGPDVPRPCRRALCAP